MQLNFLDMQQAADLVAESTLLTTLEGPGSARTLVLEYGGQDILLIADAFTGDASVIYPCSSFDREVGGSVHDDAREAMGQPAPSNALRH